MVHWLIMLLEGYLACRKALSHTILQIMSIEGVVDVREIFYNNYMRFCERYACEIANLFKKN